MVKTLGNASDFYRARIITLKEETPLEMEWHENIEYLKPSSLEPKEEIEYRIEIVEIDGDNAYPVETHRKKSKAKERLNKIEEDLRNLTKNEFEEKYKLELEKEEQ